MHECLRRQQFALLQREASRGHGGERVVIRAGGSDDRNARVVLGRGTHHRRAADVDLLDALIRSGAGGDGLTERVEVADDQLEGGHAEVVQLRKVFRLARVGEDAGVHARVQRLDTPFEALGESGELLDPHHRYAEPVDEGGRSAGGDQFDSGVVQTAGQSFETGLVVDRDQGPSDRAAAVCC